MKYEYETYRRIHNKRTNIIKISNLTIKPWSVKITIRPQ